MIRRAFTLRLEPGALAQYKEYHDNIWPELVAEIEKAGIAEMTGVRARSDRLLLLRDPRRRRLGPPLAHRGARPLGRAVQAAAGVQRRGHRRRRGADRDLPSRDGRRRMTRVAVVTGGTRGVGKAIADALEGRGVRVARVARSSGTHRADISKPAEVDAPRAGRSSAISGPHDPRQRGRHLRADRPHRRRRSAGLARDDLDRPRRAVPLLPRLPARHAARTAGAGS